MEGTTTKNVGQAEQGYPILVDESARDSGETLGLPVGEDGTDQIDTLMKTLSHANSTSKLVDESQSTPDLPHLMAPETMDLLANSFTKALVPTIRALQTHLNEIKGSQQQLLQAVREESKAIEEDDNLQELMQRMQDVPRYTTKLATLRRDMLGIHDRVLKLKKRTEKLKGKRLKQEAAAAAAREKEEMRERSLVAKPAEHLQQEDSEESEIVDEQAKATTM